jgi:hypothetical protein
LSETALIATILASLLSREDWLAEARGKALKVTAPLVCSPPAGCRYRVLLIERDYDEILESQAKMIERRGESIEDSPQRRDRLSREYDRIVEQTQMVLNWRPRSCGAEISAILRQ